MAVRPGVPQQRGAAGRQGRWCSAGRTSRCRSPTTPSVLSAELWDPATESFTTMAPAAIPRTYHSVALLMPDGRVFIGGGGLCGTCGTNHFDGEIFTPPYLLNADGTPRVPPGDHRRAPTTAANGAPSRSPPTGRSPGSRSSGLGTATHSVNTDQRRIAPDPDRGRPAATG